MVNSPAAYVPERGDLVWINYSPQVGHEQSGHRPAVVLSGAAYNGKTGLALLCPITSKTKGYPFEVALPAGLPVTGVVLADQVKSLDWRVRNAELICRGPDHCVAQIVGLIATLLRGVS